MKITLYCCGFLFNEERDHVLLIRKQKPDWQRGKVNGIGGKVEVGETPREAMRREFKEETGIWIANWEQRIVLYGEGFAVHFFSLASDDIYNFAQTESEEPILVKVRELPENVIPNLKWIVPLCLDGDIATVIIDEKAGVIPGGPK